MQDGGRLGAEGWEEAEPLGVVLRPVAVESDDGAFASGEEFLFGAGVFDVVPEVEVENAARGVGVGEADDFD